jgi:hypothetical protein
MKVKEIRKIFKEAEKSAEENNSDEVYSYFYDLLYKKYGRSVKIGWTGNDGEFTDNSAAATHDTHNVVTNYCICCEDGLWRYK